MTSEERREPFLSDVHVAASAFESRAAVVHIAAVLDFGGHGAAAAAAGQEAHKRVPTSGDAWAGRATQDALHLVERLVRHERRVGSAMALANPEEIPGVERVFQ
jgi:hypothetical protein